MVDFLGLAVYIGSTASDLEKFSLSIPLKDKLEAISLRYTLTRLLVLIQMMVKVFLMRGQSIKVLQKNKVRLSQLMLSVYVLKIHLSFGLDLSFSYTDLRKNH